MVPGRIKADLLYIAKVLSATIALSTSFACKHTSNSTDRDGEYYLNSLKEVSEEAPQAAKHPFVHITYDNKIIISYCADNTEKACEEDTPFTKAIQQTKLSWEKAELMVRKSLGTKLQKMGVRISKQNSQDILIDGEEAENKIKSYLGMQYPSRTELAEFIDLSLKHFHQLSRKGSIQLSTIKSKYPKKIILQDIYFQLLNAYSDEFDLKVSKTDFKLASTHWEKSQEAFCIIPQKQNKNSLGKITDIKWSFRNGVEYVSGTYRLNFLQAKNFKDEQYCKNGETISIRALNLQDIQTSKKFRIALIEKFETLPSIVDGRTRKQFNRSLGQVNQHMDLVPLVTPRSITREDSGTRLFCNSRHQKTIYWKEFRNFDQAFYDGVNKLSPTNDYNETCYIELERSLFTDLGKYLLEYLTHHPSVWITFGAPAKGYNSLDLQISEE